MSDRVRIGVVGAGQNTRTRHIPGLQSQRNVEIASVCNRSVASARSVADEFGINKVAETWRILVDDPELDAVVIGTWPYLHHQVTVAALEAGKHVLCEARMAMNAREARHMLEISRAHPDLVAQVVPSPFTLGVDSVIKDLISDGYLGSIVAVDVNAVTGEFPLTEELHHWRNDRELSGNNILSLGIWYEALMRWIGETTHVVAMGKQVIPFRRQAETGNYIASTIPDHIDVIGRLACGGQLHMQLSSVAVGEHAPAAILYGSEGTIKFAANTLYGRKRGEDSFSVLEVPAEKAGAWRVEEDFIEAIRGIGPIKLTTFADGVKYMEFTDAVSESLATGRMVAV